MGLPPRLLCCLFLTLSLAAAATRHHEWHSDCVRKLAVTINGHTLGPTIRAIQGDNVVDQVNNSLLTKNVAIHWHGIRQIIGTEGVTQCPILPGDVFTYTFTVDHPGTYMYHAHYEMQRSAGLNGIIVVEAAAARGAPDAEPFAYDGEHDKLLNDRWHKSTYEQASGLAAVPIGWVGEPQSLLINGRGRFVNCSSMAAGACNATHPECPTQLFAVVPGKTYRFRISSVTSLMALNFEIEGQAMTGAEADVHYVKPFAIENNLSIVFYTGVFIKAEEHPNRNYGLAYVVVNHKPTSPRRRTPATPCASLSRNDTMYRFHFQQTIAMGTAILSYYGGQSSPGRAPPTTPPTGPACNDNMYRFRQSMATVAHVKPPPPRADRTILLLNTQNKIDDRRIKCALNNVSFTLPHTPYVLVMKNGLLGGAVNRLPPPETYPQVGERQSLLINGRGWFVVGCSTMAARVCNATHQECATPAFAAVVPGKTYRSRCFRIANLTSLSALNFEIEGHDHEDAPVTVEAVASSATRTRPPTIAAYLAPALVAVLVYLLSAEARSRHPVVGQEPAAAEDTITSAPSPSASSDSPPSTCPPSTTGSNPSGPSAPPSELEGSAIGTEEDPSSGPPGAPPHQRPAVPPTPTAGVRDNEAPLLSFVGALFTYDSAVAVGIFLHGFESIISGWSTAPKVLYVLSAVLVVVLLGIGFMAAGCYFKSKAENIDMLWVSAFCVKLGAILSTDLVVVGLSSNLGRAAAAGPSAAVTTLVMAAVWKWGNHHAVENAVRGIVGLPRQRQPAAAGDDMA